MEPAGETSDLSNPREYFNKTVEGETGAEDITSHRAIASLKVIAAVFKAVTCLIIPASTIAGNEPEGAWQFSVTPYLWVPHIEIELPSGADFDLSMDDVVSNLEMAALGHVEARRGKWSFALDGLYMDLGVDRGGSLSLLETTDRELTLDADVDLEFSIWTGSAGYELWRSETGHLDLILGARYLDITVGLEASRNLGPVGSATEVSADGSNLNGIAGFKGRLNLGEKWFMPYHADIGAGELDLVWQFVAGVGYQFGWGGLNLVYRHMKWDFGSGEEIDTLEANGPMLSAEFIF